MSQAKETAEELNENDCLEIIGLMEDFQNSDFEGLEIEAQQVLLDEQFENSKKVIGFAQKCLTIIQERTTSRDKAIEECVETLRQSHHLVCSCDGNGCPRIAHIVAKFQSLKQEKP